MIKKSKKNIAVSLVIQQDFQLPQHNKILAVYLCQKELKTCCYPLRKLHEIVAKCKNE